MTNLNLTFPAFKRLSVSLTSFSETVSISGQILAKRLKSSDFSEL